MDRSEQRKLQEQREQQQRVERQEKERQQQQADDESAEERDYLTEQLPTSTRFDIRLPVFIPATVIILAFVLAGVLFTNPFGRALEVVQGFITEYFGWFYIVTINIVLVFVIWLGLGRYGEIKLGPDDSEPDFGYLAWFSMLFSAGIGIGFLFYGVAEPISHFAISQPPWVEAEPGTPDAARESMNAVFVNWGLHAWGIYVIIALALCYFSYRRGLPLALRSAFYPIIGDRIRGWMGDVVDTLAIVGTLFGVAISLGLGSTQINSGLNIVLGISQSMTVQLTVIGVITAIAVVSVVSGLNTGIRLLSIGNILLFSSLLVFVLVAGPTVYVLDMFPQNVGTYIQQLPSTAFQTQGLSDSSWFGNWSLFYWGWWISWSPFVGMFIARISRGRTIREFVAVVLLMPVLATFAIFTVFGNTAFFFELTGQSGIVEATTQSFESSFFAMLDHLPLASITSVVAILVVTVFFITSSDSGSLVDDIHASGGNIHPSRATRIYWGVTEGVVAATLLVAAGEAGLTAFQLAALSTGLPLAVLLLAMCYALFASLRRDVAIQEMDEEERRREETRRVVIREIHERTWPIRSAPRGNQPRVGVRR